MGEVPDLSTRLRTPGTGSIRILGRRRSTWPRRRSAATDCTASSDVTIVEARTPAVRWPKIGLPGAKKVGRPGSTGSPYMVTPPG